MKNIKMHCWKICQGRWLCLIKTLLDARERAQLYSLIKFTNFGNTIIAKNDLYLPYLYEYDLDTWDWLTFEKDHRTILSGRVEEIMSLLDFGEFQEKQYKNIIKTFNEYKENFLTPEEVLIVRKKLFHFSYSDLLKEIKEDKNNNLYFKGDVRNKANESLKLIHFMKNYTLMMEDII